MKGNWLRLAVAVMVLAAWSTGAAARYTVTRIVPPEGWDYFQPRKVNDRGQMIGRLDASTGPFKDESHAGFYSRGRVTDMHVLARGWERLSASLPLDLNDHGVGIFYGMGDGPRDRTFLYHNGRLLEFSRLVRRTDLDAFGINNRGEIVGSRFNLAANIWEQGFVWRHGKVKFLGKLAGYEENFANAINDRGLIVGGGSEGVLDEAQAAVFVGKAPISLGIPNSWPVDVNERGHIVGLRSGGIGYSGFIWKEPGVVIDVPFAPEGFNDAGQVVGSAGPWPPHALLFENGVTHDLNDLVDAASGWTLMYAHDINNRGEIVGWGRVNEGWSGFLLQPQEGR